MQSISRDFTFDLRKLRVLQEVQRRGTVSAAASELHLTPSAVSQQLAGLSRELGVPLIEKRGRGVALTGQARVVLRHADAVREQLERTRADLLGFSEGTIGEIRIGSLATGIAALAAPALARLRESHPGLSVVVREHEPEENLAALESGDIDVAIMAENVGVPARSDPRYHRTSLVTDVMDVVLPPGHSAAATAEVRLAVLADDVWVGGSPGDACSRIAMGVCAAAGFTPNVRYYCRDWDAVAALVAAGAGVALIPRLAQPLRHGDAVIRPVHGPTAARSLFALVRAGVEEDPGTAAVLSTLQEVAASAPSLEIH